MPPFIADFLGPLIGFVTVGSMVLIGMKMRYNFRAQQLQGGASKETVERLESQLEAVRDQLLAMRDDVGELYERVEFAERLLARGKGNAE